MMAILEEAASKINGGESLVVRPANPNGTLPRVLRTLSGVLVRRVLWSGAEGLRLCWHASAHAYRQSP